MDVFPIGDIVRGVSVADLTASILLWAVLSLYIAGDLYWLYEVLVFGWRYESPERVYGPEDVQVRILTIDAESVVRESVRKLPEELDERIVIAEEDLDIPNATVRVVPEEFECEATNKGRAMEWARRTIGCDREYVLYLDEDSHLLEFGGLPDADIVQFTEHPRRTSSRLTFFAEINRIGFQIEQRAFPSLKVPLYAWGGGLAVRKSLEDTITWNYPTVIEDTVFLWRGKMLENATFEYINDRISNQAPPSLSEMFQQRRRWIGGSREDNEILSLDRVLMFGIRDISWAVTGLIPALAVVSLIPWTDLVFYEMYRIISFVLLGVLFVWILIGIRTYNLPLRVAIAVIILAPLTTVLHSIGALWGLVSPPETFEVTEKLDETGSHTNSRPETNKETS